MTQVSNQAELLAALTALETDIEVIANITINVQVNINYAVTISSGGGIFMLQKAPAYFNPMFRVQNGGSLTLQNIILDGDAANHPESNTANRSLIYVAGGTLTLTTGSILQNNNTYLEGGGVYLTGNISYVNTLVMNSNAIIQDCYSRASGGAIMGAFRNNADSITISGNAVIQNNQALSGGGIYVRSYVQNVSGTCTITDNVQIIENTASGTGGGITLSGFRDGNSTPVNFTLGGNVNVSSNTAVHGAGLYFFGANTGDNFTITDSATILHNMATGNGGGVYYTFPLGNGEVNIIGGRIESNSAAIGGGIFITSATGGNFTFNNTFIDNNVATVNSGGGIFIQNTSAINPTSVTINNTEIESNQCAVQGGGLYYITGDSPFTLTINGSTIESNHADTNGGGILLGSTGGGSITVTNSTFNFNTCDNFGGAFYYVNNAPVSATINIDTCEFNDNTAGAHGGAIRFGSGNGSLDTVITNSPILRNNANSDRGGGIWIGGTNNNLTLSNSQVSYNTSILGNGGGIYFNTLGGMLTLQNSTQINYNRVESEDQSTGQGGGICLIPGIMTMDSTCEIAYNYASVAGGGIAATQGSMTTISGAVHNNTTGIYGGGIYNNVLSSLYIAGGDIYNNTAAIGGGICNRETSTVFLDDGVDIGRLGLNTATRYAPGIYNEGTLYGGKYQDIENGFYINDRQAVFRITSPITSGSVIQLDNSNYVFPNAEGIPIVVAEATPQYPILSQSDADAFKKPLTGFNGWGIVLSDDQTQVLLVPLVYTITYLNLMGATNPNPTTYTVFSPTINLLPPSDVPGYRFIGWYTAPEGGERVTQIPSGTVGDIVLYARFEPILPDQVTVAFIPNDEGGPPAQGIPVTIIVSPPGQDVMIPVNIPTRMGYEFIGYNTSPDGTGTTYYPGQIIPNVTSDIALYAQWRIIMPPPPPPIINNNCCCNCCCICKNPCDNFNRCC